MRRYKTDVIELRKIMAEKNNQDYCGNCQKKVESIEIHWEKFLDGSIQPSSLK